MKKGKKILLTVLSSVMTAACALGAVGCNFGKPQGGSSDTDAQFKTAYALYVTYAEANGETPATYEDWLASIKGEKGDEGKSAYQIWLDNGHTGSQADFLEWLKGETGAQGEQGETGPQGPQGEKGDDGKSAYEIWLANGYTGTQADFLEWLNGTAGVEGPQGEKGETGPQGPQGEQGETGPQGPQGEAGVGIENVELDENGDFKITYTDGRVQILENPYVDCYEQLLDQQAVSNMNARLSLCNDGNMTTEKAMKVLDEAGFNMLNALVPVSKGHGYYYDNTNNTVVLVDTTTDKVVYPKDYPNTFSSTWIDLRDDGVKYIDVYVASVNDFTTALMLGAKEVTLEKDVKVTGSIAVAEGAKTVIDLNGKKLDASKNDSRPFNVTGNTELTINATGSTVNVGKYGLVNVAAGSNAKVEIVGGTYIANENSDNGAFIKARPGATADITLNNVNYVDTTGENYIVNAYDATASNLTVIGGTYKAKGGFHVVNGTFTNVTIETEGVCMEVTKGGKTTVTGCTLTSGTLYDGMEAACVAVGYGATATVTNCTLKAATYGLSILPGDNDFDGSITATNLTFVDTAVQYYNYNNTAVGYIEVDGTVVLGRK